MPSIFEYISYGELMRLIVCASLDIVEYIIPILITPFVGDIFDVIAVIISVVIFSWIGLFSALDLIPGLDVLPVNILTWVVWMIRRRWKDFEDALRYGRF